MVRFFERPIIAKLARLVGSAGRSGGQNYIDPRVMLVDPTSKTKAIRAAIETNLRKDNVDFLPGIQDGDDVGGGDALQNPVSAVAQIACNDHPVENVGFDD
jgi:hypothetical protein